MAFGRMGLMGRGFGHEGGSPGGANLPPAGSQFETVTDINGVEQYMTVTDINGVEQRITVAVGTS